MVWSFKNQQGMGTTTSAALNTGINQKPMESAKTEPKKPGITQIFPK